MIVEPTDYFVLVWLALALASAAYVAFDQFRGNPEPLVMKWGFVLVTLYMGPIGLLLYVLADKEPRPGTHEEFVSPLWKQAVGSTIHCVAGDATGIILAAVVTISLGLAMQIDLVVEYVAGFACGLLVFQALFMMRIMGGGYLDNLKRSFLPELVSMNAMMAGMAPVMSLLMMGRDMRAMQPWQPLFWFVMSVGVIVGFAAAYPVNVWLVRKQLKHGLMTERAVGRVPKQAAGAAMTVPEHSGMAHGMAMAGMASKGSAGGAPSAPMTAGAEGATAHGGHGQARLSPAAEATFPQKIAVAGVTGVFLLAGLFAPGFFVNLSLNVDEVGGAIMPPGMIMEFNTPAGAMRDMSAVRPSDVTYAAPADARGDQVLEPRIENGVKVFAIEASIIRWHILPDVTVDAYAYNRQIPGPRLTLTEGDRVRIDFHNALPEPSSIHWHGLVVPNAMDGPAWITQPPVPPGGSFSYEFTVSQSGTYFYHSHASSDRQQGLGLYGALIVSPRDAAAEPKADLDYTVQLQEWLKRGWLTYPAMIMEGGLPNYFTINGKAYPATDTIRMRVGQTVKIRFIGTSNNFIHPMHVHGGPFEVVAIDGETLKPSARFLADTVNIGPGQRYDVIWTAREPGKWLVHCHIPHHTTNNNVEVDGGGGLTMLIDVSS